MQLIDLGQLKERGIEKRIFGHDFVYRFPESKDMPKLNVMELANDLVKGRQGSIAFYFHIPFCSKHCNFCHYYKELPASAKEIEKYLLAMKRELSVYRELLGKRIAVQSVFFGGGTPTLLRAEQLAGLLDFFAGLFPFGKEVEVTIESSPETLSREKLPVLREAGFNRLSIGTQDFDEKVLSASNRAHSPKQAERAVGDAREAGFGNINMDLIYGLPGQNAEGWERTVEKVLELGLDSVTASDLRVRKNTAFFSWGRKQFPRAEEMRKMYYSFVETFLGAGYLQQFPYQFVRKGKEMQFLENQWGSGEFIGVGASSCSFVSNWDYNNSMPLHDYFQRVGETGIAASRGKKLLDGEQMKRFVALGLKRSGLNRKGSGISRGKFASRFGVELGKEFGEEIAVLEEMGLVEEKGSSIALSYNGLFFHDEVAREFFRKR